ncbi:MAG: acetyl-CoA carboxylase biotin carboxylase subunit [Saprospiraceae bacterium]
MINAILIANRGEIASRILRTCRKMGIRSIAVFSDADRDAPYVVQADTAVHIGNSNPTESYLDQDKIIAVAQAQGADAIHPGYGFLSENAAFAEKCAVAKIIFIGPNPNAIRAMGSKSRAKAIMQQHNVPTIPGYQGEDQQLETLMAAAKKIKFPLLLKATAGGGGKGMRIVHRAEDLEKNIRAAQREAQSAFGDAELIIEKYIAKGRHIEFQIFGDQHGNALHILERECSIQRRYQKVIEESPSPVLSAELREKMGAAAVQAAKALNYDNAGTVEFIFDDTTQDFYFLEVNTRLQVEHPVTEEVTGLDLVQLQIEVAEGQPLSIQQAEISAKGYAVEARLYAEDATNNFTPATGTVQLWEVPQVDGLRIETAVETGSEISIHYDPMIAKIIVWDESRRTAHRKMAYTLQHLKCLGLTTNQDFLLHLFQQKAIQEGDYDTHYLQNYFDEKTLLTKSDQQKQFATAALTLWNWQQREQERDLLRALPSGWRNSRYAPQQVNYQIGEEVLSVKYEVVGEQAFHFYEGETRQQVELVKAMAQQVIFRFNGVQYAFAVAKKENTYYLQSPQTGNLTLSQQLRFPIKETEKVSGGYIAPMPSQIVQVLVETGQKVSAGDALMVISSMKMENTIEATESGVVEEVYAAAGQNVEAGFLLLKLETNEVG